MKLFSALRLAAVFTLLCVLSLGAMAQTTSPLSSIFNNKGELSIESVQNTARAQMPTTPYYKSNGEETVWFEGYFRAASNNTKLALLSDDGTSVVIDGEQVLGRAGQTQGFEGEGTHRRGDLVWKNGFDVTFYPLAKTFTAGQVYHLRLQYTNTIHDSEVDVDGLSLWAYDGGGSIIDLNITASGDYIVPGSTKNRVDYTLSSTTFTANSGTFKVFKNGDVTNAVRTITLTGSQLQGGNHYLEWDGCDSNGSPLTEADSPYTFRITLGEGTTDIKDEESDRKVKEWGLVFVTQDRSSPDTNFETGVNEATIAEADGEPKNLQVKVEVSGGASNEIPFFDVTPDTGPQEWDADVALKQNAAGDWFILYTTPTPIQGHPEIKYAVKLSQIAPYVQDWGGNPWDMDDTTEAQETKTNWDFRISPTGDLLDFQASYQ